MGIKEGTGSKCGNIERIHTIHSFFFSISTLVCLNGSYKFECLMGVSAALQHSMGSSANSAAVAAAAAAAAAAALDDPSLLSAEAVEVLDKMREGSDLLRNNTNSFLSGELLPSALLGAPPAGVGLLPQTVRINMPANPDADAQGRHKRGGHGAGAQPGPPAGGSDPKKEPKDDGSSKDKDVAATRNTQNTCANPMSVSVPNLTCAAHTPSAEPVNPVGLLETFAAMARRRAPGALAGGQAGMGMGGMGPASPSCSNHANSPGSALFARGPSSVSSLVRLALSSNFPGESSSLPCHEIGTGVSGGRR